MKLILGLACLVLYTGCVKRFSANESAMQVVADPTSDRASFDKSLKKLAGHNVSEAPSFWISIVNGSNYDFYRKRECLFQLFRRHLHSNAPVSVFAEWGCGDWFTEKTLVLTLPGPVPVKSVNGNGIFMFRPPLLETEQSAIYWRLSAGLPQNLLLDAIHGKNVSSDVRILEVGFSRPPNRLAHRE